MKVDRRRFLQGTAAAAAAGAFSSPAWADDPIAVASIHDLSGGLDIYGKPMVDALTLAVEEANAAGGLLGRQIKLINYDTAVEHAALYAICAASGAEGQGRGRAWRHHLGLARSDPAGARPLQDAVFLQYAVRRRRLRPQPVRHRRDPGADGGKARALRHEEMGQEGLRRRGRLQLRSDHLAMGEEIRHATMAAKSLAIDFFPLDVTNFGPTISKIQAAKPDFVWSALVGGAHISFYRQWAAAGMHKAFRWRRPPSPSATSTSCCRRKNATACWCATITSRT